MWRKALALLFLTAGGLAIARFVIVPWRCNMVEARVSDATPEQVQPSDDPRARGIAEENVEAISRCLADCRTDVNLAMLTGANLLILGRADAAASVYSEALRYDKRPELYVALATVQAQLGLKDAAIRSAVQAADFAGLKALNDIPDVAVRWRAVEIAGARQEKLMTSLGRLDMTNLVANGRFTQRGPATTTLITGYGTKISAAASWESISPYGETTTTLVPSPRRPGGTAIHVTTTRDVAGLRQVWPKKLNAPRVRTTVWVFVTRGRVSMGSGNAVPMTNAYSTTTGRWEKLEAVNESCPANMTMIQAASPDGADFIVDEVRVQRTLAAPPCEP